MRVVVVREEEEARRGAMAAACAWAAAEAEVVLPLVLASAPAEARPALAEKAIIVEGIARARAFLELDWLRAGEGEAAA